MSPTPRPSELARLALALAATVLLPASLAHAQINAWVYEVNDPWTNSLGDASARLSEAGFLVQPLPLDESPAGLTGLIFLGSFASEDAAYGPYMDEYGDDLADFVESGNVLVQMTQADQTEAEPPFLPPSLSARRDDLDASQAYVMSPGGHLLADVPITGDRLTMNATRVVWESLSEQAGFEVMLSANPNHDHPALMEGAHGQGRYIFMSIPWDKPGPSHGIPVGDRLAFARPFCANLISHVNNVMNGTAPPLDITTPTYVGFAEAGWKLVLLPDTQIYAQDFPGLFDAQTIWIARNKERYNIQYVLHLGDITNTNAPLQWDRAAASMSILDCTVPYAIVGGNHDYGPGGNAATRDTYLNDYFNYDVQAAWPTFGGAMEPGKLDNTYHLFEAGGRQWIIIALEWGPRDSTVAWANSIMNQHPDRTGILITHAYMNNNDLRYDHTDTAHPQTWNPHNYSTAGGVNDGEELWQELVRHHRFAFTFNGHVLGDGTGYLASTTDLGNTCHQMLSNYQFRTLGGESYLRVIEFLPDGRTVHVRTYSPLYDKFMTAPDQNFTVQLD